MTRYRFLLFDADYTLLDFDADMTAAFEKMYAHCGFDKQQPYSEETLKRYEACNVRWWGNFEQQLCTKQELYVNRFVDFLKETGLSGDPEEMNRVYFDFLAQGGATYPGAIELLEALSAQYEIYIITNGNAVSSKNRLERSGLLPFVKDIFVSETVGVGKPDKRYFDYVAAHIQNYAPEQALVIGDSMSSDILGAHNAGLHSLWYTGVWVDPNQKAPFTYRAESYDEIKRILL